MAKITLDLFEYSTDALAYVAYIYSATANSTWSKALGSYTAANKHNQRIVLAAADISTSGTAIRIKLKGHSTTSVTISGASIGARSGATGNFASTPTRLTFNGGNSTGTIPSGDYLYSDWISFTIDETANYLVHLAFVTNASNPVCYTTGGSRYVHDNYATDDTLTVDISSSGYTNNSYVVSITGVDVDSPAVAPYSEATIKEQGSYALKAVASTSALNKTLTKTLSSTVNLSDCDSATFRIRSSRTGSNIKLGIKDSGGTTTEVTPNIASADTWQTGTIDLSGVADADKDAISQIIITIVNADAANTFYIDNMEGVENIPTNVSATCDSLAITTYDADVHNIYYVNAGTDALAVTANAADVKVDTNVLADYDALVIASFDANINAALNIAAGVDALVVATFDANVSLGINVNATVDNLILTGLSAGIKADTNIQTGIDALAITTHEADVNLNVSVNATCDALILAKFSADVNLNVFVNTVVDALILSGKTANINAEIHVHPGYDALVLSGKKANINAAINVHPNYDYLSLHGWNAEISHLPHVILSRDWKDYKGDASIWIDGFVPQEDKWGYINNERWTE